jgi:hypothetical protein
LIGAFKTVNLKAFTNDYTVYLANWIHSLKV